VPFTNDIQKALDELSEGVWSSTPTEDGFAILSSPKCLRAELQFFEDRMVDEFDDEWGFPWGLDDYSLISMKWNAAGPELGSLWTLYGLCLPSGRRVYIEDADWGDGPKIISASDLHWTPRIDRKLLQGLFKDNGSSFGIGLIGSPPNEVSSCVKSFAFVTDLFVTGFDAAGDQCWEALLDGWDVWNDDYENPVSPIGVPTDMLEQATVEDILAHGQPRSLGQGLSHQHRVQDLAYGMLGEDEINEFINDHRLRRRLPNEPDAKVQIVARYLSQVLGRT
jgi:hypothetical protein